MQKTRLIAVASFVMMLGYTPSSFATPIELVVNGSFDSPYVGSGWTTLANGSLPGWSNSTGTSEIWASGFNASSMPLNDSKGNPVDQNLEVTYVSDAEVESQVITAPGSDGTVSFSFDTWARSANGITYSLTGSTSGVLASGTYSYSDNNWNNISYSNLHVTGGETLTLRFQSVGGADMGAHIDNVSVLYSAVPEPSTTMLMGIGGLGMMGLRRRKSSDVA